MTSDNARASDGGAAADRNPLIPGERKYKVLAEGGISYSHPDEPDGTAETGKTVTLSWDGARALLAEGSIEEA